ncbi:hypothetical protein [Clostridioides difficile]|uniref:hypothetical protein n=1 Tax=Clostridioides difficile TaxID=1496 RepID=UPI00038D216E|nr:hypothetical protein [Clostridioides difficile]EKS6786718.1 hypothetical protein [Clostridioides difficile]EQE56586.1 hypothetical protein QCE_0907 [Clostridioides difficile CD42]EQF29376.1 hypothetical protein QEU_0911 [Clostridioides difficile CD159]EQF33567.1 hypothetical protein QEY_0942 [Clostridioides difficile CD165]EQG08237.1 hypothetical protein QIC_3336 [Clostridioides difficile DA00044]
MKSRQELIKDIERYRKAQYLIYLDIVQRAWADRSLTADEQDRIKQEAYAEYKRIERDTEEAEELLIREEFETDRPIAVQIM